jgi:GTP-binding protein Era
LEEIDAVLYVVDTARPVGPEEEELAALLAHSEIPVVTALNKIDVGASRKEELAEFIHRTLPRSPVLPISAETGDGVEELLAVLIDLMPESDYLYPADYYTDQDPEFRVAEVLREQAIARTREELPHALYVEVADMEVQAAKPKRGEKKPRGPQETLWIRAFIVVERESQQGIVVGKGGERIRDIRSAAQERLKELFDYQIYLDLRVKVQPKWRRTDAVLNRLVH